MRLSLGVVLLAISAVPLGWSPPNGGPATHGVTPESDRASYSYDCPRDYVLIGIGGRQGWWMDAAWGICGRIRSDGTLNSGERRVTRRAGGTGGTAGGRVCPTGMVLVGYTGTSKTYVHTIRTITCSTWSSANRVASSGVNGYRAFPEKGPGGYIQTLCKYGMVGSGISGRAGSYLDTFSVKCTYAPYANPPVSLRPVNLNVSGQAWIVKSCSRDLYGNCV